MADPSGSTDTKNLTDRHWLRQRISKLPFSVKVIVHIILILLLTGISITTIVGYQFRRELHQLEYSNALSVYTSTLNFVLAHYISNEGQLNTDELDRLLQRIFTPTVHLAPEHIDQMVPDQVEFYGPDESSLYQYATLSATNTTTGSYVSDALKEWHDKKQNTIHLAGPVKGGEETLGYLHVRIPTNIDAELTRLYRRTLSVTISVVVLAAALSLLFAQTYLAPILDLTRAARKIRQGDFNQTVTVKSEDEIGVLTATFNEMANAMGNRLQLMHQMQTETVRISRELEFDSLLKILSSIFTRMSGSPSYRLYLRNSQTGKLEVAEEVGADLLPKPESDQLTKLAFEERWAQFLKDNGRMDSEPGNVLELAIPLLSGQHRVGVIRIGPRSDDEIYNEDVLTTLQTLAQHASVSLDNTALLAQLTEKQKIEQEMELAREIQQAMLPSHEPDIPGYQVTGGSLAALSVGGDYYDYIQSVDAHIHLVLGDVSGKGVPAALIMSIVRSLMHSFSELDADPLEVLRKVNHRITHDIEPEMFVTMAMVDLNAASHTARVVRAGHEPILILKPSGEITPLAPPGTGVGLVDIELFNKITQAEDYIIQPGETLILYTDGVTEAQNQDREDFGQERLYALLKQHKDQSLQDMFASIHAELSAYTKGMSQFDDITLLMLRREEHP